METDENARKECATRRAQIAFMFSVFNGVALRAKLSLDYSKWVAVATGVAVAYVIEKLPATTNAGDQNLMMLGAFCALTSLILAAVVYRFAIDLLPLGELLRMKKEINDSFGAQDPEAMSKVVKKFADDVEESGFRGSILRAIGAADSERAAKLANSKVRLLEHLAVWQFALVIVAGVCMALSVLVQTYCKNSQL